VNETRKIDEVRAAAVAARAVMLANFAGPDPNRAKERPRVCPKCKSQNWDKPRLYERKTH
jgi:hypothetical protein